MGRGQFRARGRSAPRLPLRSSAADQARVRASDESGDANQRRPATSLAPLRENGTNRTSVASSLRSRTNYGPTTGGLPEAYAIRRGTESRHGRCADKMLPAIYHSVLKIESGRVRNQCEAS